MSVSVVLGLKLTEEGRDMRGREEVQTIPGSFVSGLAHQMLQLERAIARQADRFSAFIDIGAQIASARDVDQLLRTVMERLTTFLGAEAATLFMYDAESDELWSRLLKGTAIREIRLSATQGIAGHVFTSGRTLRLADAYRDRHFNPEIDRRSGFKTRSVIATPLRHMSGRVLGVLQVLDRRVDVFDLEDQVLVEAVATQIASVVDHVVLVEELQLRSAELAERVRDLDALFEVEQAISSSEKQTDLLANILVRSIEAVGARAGSILVVEEDRNSLFFRNDSKEGSPELQMFRLKPGQGIAGRVAASGDIVRVLEAEECEFFDRGLARKLGIAKRSVLCVPIHVDGQTLGALEFVNKRGGFNDADERLAVVLAGQVGRAMVQRRSREEEERKVRLASIGQMLSGVLHDLRTPLTVITGYAEMMAEENDPVVRDEMAKSILSQIENMSAMQMETLAFARGERSVFMRKVYMQNFVAELKTLLGKEFEATQVELRVQSDYNGLAKFDESKMRRLIFNLARNAIEAMAKAGRFQLSITKVDAELVFVAQDNGPGIPPEIEGRLFESFVTQGKKNGTGLGLAIVRKIAEEHGGTVVCRSKAGKGTTFEVRIPLGVAGE
jgi:signal transduction histidine kinase